MLLWNRDVPQRTDHNTWNSMWVLFYIPQGFEKLKGCRTGPMAYRSYYRRLESLTICRCHYKNRTFSSVILRPWVLVRPELNLQPPAWHHGAQPTEPQCRTTGARWLKIMVTIIKESCCNKDFLGMTKHISSPHLAVLVLVPFSPFLPLSLWLLVPLVLVQSPELAQLILPHDWWLPDELSGRCILPGISLINLLLSVNLLDGRHHHPDGKGKGKGKVKSLYLTSVVPSVMKLESMEADGAPFIPLPLSVLHLMGI